MDNFDKVLEQKDLLNVKLQTVLKSMTVDSYNELFQAGVKFYSQFENYVVKKSKSVKNKVEREDLLNSIKNIFDFNLQYFYAIKIISERLDLPYQSSQNLLATSERLYATYCKKDSEMYKEEFVKQNLSVVGFDSKEKLHMGTKHYEPLPLGLGIIILFITVVLGFTLKIDTSIKYLIMRVIISLSLALILRGVFKDFIELKINVKSKYAKVAITAFGAFAIFLITYFFNPAKPPEYMPDSQIEINK